MNTSLTQTSTTTRFRPWSFSGSILGKRWSLSIRPHGAAWDEKLDDLPEVVGTEGIPPHAKSVQLTFDFEHLYMTGVDNRPASCRIRVFSPVNDMLQSIGQAGPGLISPITYSSQEPTIVLCEPLVIGGITNSAEEIATAVWLQLGRPGQLTWIEHWWKSDSPLSREFLCIQFLVNTHGVLTDPQWTEVMREAVEQLVGPVEEIQRAQADRSEEGST